MSYPEVVGRGGIQTEGQGRNRNRDREKEAEAEEVGNVYMCLWGKQQKMGGRKML